MKTLKNIVIGTSLTDKSDEVVRTGLAIARATGATPWLIHAGALLLDPSGAGADALWTEQSWNSLRELLDEQARRTWLAALPGFSPDQVRLTMGAPHREIVALARGIQADLVVIGAAESPHMLGSTADRVIRKAPCPVLAVRSEAAFPPLRVEIPVDLSPISANALRLGLGFLAQLGLPATEPEVLFVLNPFEVGGSINFTPEQIRHFAEEELSRFVTASVPGSQRPPSTRVRTGYARDEILGVLKERRVDLAVLGTHGRSGFERFMLGSIAARVLKNAECNLLIVPPAIGYEENRAGADWTYVSDEAPAAAGRF
ncbi:MAG: universal stress protein [Thermoanaerobaculia bacterium]